MASGKSTVGRELAQRLNWDFIDLDVEIEARERQSVPEIFRQRGEPGFRLVETNLLRDLLTGSMKRDSVVALGGGAFAQKRNRELLQAWPTVFLEAPADELWRRSLTDGIERPLRADPEQFARLYSERLPFYRQATVTIVTSGRDLTSLCAEIERNLQSWGSAGSAGAYQGSQTQSETGEIK
jgi:shikimate kinase